MPEQFPLITFLPIAAARNCDTRPIKQTPPAAVSPGTSPSPRSPHPRSHPAAPQSSDRTYPDPPDTDTRPCRRAQTSMSRDHASLAPSQRSDQRPAQAPDLRRSHPRKREKFLVALRMKFIRVPKNLPPAFSEIATKNGVMRWHRERRSGRRSGD